MKYYVRRFKSLAVALKELEPFIRDGAHLQSGKPFARFGGMRSREILANWLLCVTINTALGKELTFSSDPTGGDGVIYDTATGETWNMEHVMVPRFAAGEEPDAHELIVEAIELKCRKGGAAYAAGKTLVVFIDAAAGAWFPNRVARRLPDPLHFDAVWVVGLQGVEEREYVYGVASLDLSRGDAPAFRVRIAHDFGGWDITQIQ
jgi:hypothetical protein